MAIIFGDEEFRRKVEHLTKVADRSPLLFRAHVLLLVVAGYSTLFLVLIACVAIVAIACWQLLAHFIKFRIVYFGWAIAPAIIFAGMVWRALWIELPEPKGVPIKRDEAPELFRVIEEARRKLDTAPIHSVQFDWYLNAAFTQRPRFGIFGWTKGYLTIGLPLLLGLSAENLRALLAHELGHFSRNHSRFASWIYSVNQTWEQFLHECRLRTGDANAIFVSLGMWYLRELRAHSFMLARTHEYEADQYTAELCGEAHAAQSLLQLSVVTRFVGERFWPAIWRESKLQAAPPADVFVRMKMAIENGWSSTDDAEWRKQALADKADFFDYHPSLSERLSTATIGSVPNRRDFAFLINCRPPTNVRGH
jgi:Zn-dependent protease with chaperone function